MAGFMKSRHFDSLEQRKSFRSLKTIHASKVQEKY